MGKPASESRQSDDVGRSALSRTVIETETRREVHSWNMIASNALVRLALCLTLAMGLNRMVITSLSHLCQINVQLMCLAKLHGRDGSTRNSL